MRILHAYSSFHPKRGGVPVAVASLAQAQRDAGADARLLSADRLGDPAVEALFAGRGWAELPLIRLPAIRVGGRVMPRPTRALTTAVRSADLVHIHGIWEPLGPMLALAARARGVPYVVAPHGMLAPWSVGRHSRRKRLALAMGYNSFLRHASFVHMLNAPERDEVARGLTLPDRLEIIPNGVFRTDFSQLPAKGSFRSHHPELGDAPFVLFMGRLHLQKGLLILADAFREVARQHPTARLVIAGPDDGGREPFTMRARELGLTDRIHLVGPLYDDQKWAALVDATVFCLPSYQEAFSIAITEALAAGLPCVISEAAHYPLVQEIRAGRVVPLDPSATASALLDLLNTPDETAQMGRRGAQHVRDHLAWDAIAEHSLQLYGEIARSPQPNPESSRTR